MCSRYILITSMLLLFSWSFGLAPVPDARAMRSDDGKVAVTVKRKVTDKAISESLIIHRDGFDEATAESEFPFDGGIVLPDTTIWAYGYEHGLRGISSRPSRTNRLYIWQVTPTREVKLIASIERNTVRTGTSPTPTVCAMVFHKKLNELHVHCQQEHLKYETEWLRFDTNQLTSLAPIYPDQPAWPTDGGRVVEIEAKPIGETGFTATSWLVSRLAKKDERETMVYDQVVIVTDRKGSQVQEWRLPEGWTKDVDDLVDRSQRAKQVALGGRLRVEDGSVGILGAKGLIRCVCTYKDAASNLIQFSHCKE